MSAVTPPRSRICTSSSSRSQMGQRIGVRAARVSRGGTGTKLSMPLRNSASVRHRARWPEAPIDVRGVPAAGRIFLQKERRDPVRGGIRTVLSYLQSYRTLLEPQFADI